MDGTSLQGVRTRFSTPIVAGIVVLALAACSAPEPAGSPSASPAPTSSSAPASSPTAPALADDVAFVVSGTLVAPDGATRVGFELTVGAPLPGTTGDEATFAASTLCPPEGYAAYRDLIDQPAFVHLALRTTLLTGATREGDNGIVTGTDGPLTWSGDYSTGQSMCGSAAFRTFPGAADGIFVVEQGIEVGEEAVDFAWLPARGGFGFVIDRPRDDGSVVEYTVEECELDLGPASAGTAAVDLIRVDRDLGCEFGFRDG